MQVKAALPQDWEKGPSYMHVTERFPRVPD